MVGFFGGRLSFRCRHVEEGAFYIDLSAFQDEMPQTKKDADSVQKMLERLQAGTMSESLEHDGTHMGSCKRTLKSLRRMLGIDLG